jgi:ABC-type transport system involved in cytochrome c biogenesis permease subunit
MSRLLVWLLVVCLGSAPVAAAIPADMLGDFAALPILHEGRLKPLDSVARLQFRANTGQTAPNDRTALVALAEALFTPAAVLQRPQFYVPEPDLRHRLGLPERPEHRYDFQTLVAAMVRQQAALNAVLAADKKTLAADDRALLALYIILDDYRQLTGALSLVLPITLPLVSDARLRLGVAESSPLTLLALLKLKPALMEAVQATLAVKGERVATYTDAEQANATLAYQLALLESVGANNVWFRVIPPLWEQETAWRSPWDVVQAHQRSPASEPFFQAWQQAAQAWQNGDQLRWQQAMAQLTQALHQVQPVGLRAEALRLEIWLNRTIPFTVALWALGLGLGVLVYAVAYAVPRARRGAALALVLGRGLLLLALLLQGLGLLARMVILQRPPVSTLYESTLFVSCVALACGLLLAWRKAQTDGLFIGGGIAALLLLSSFVFGADGDTLLVLTAVLDTNVWLATHVVCITIGYAATLVAGFMAQLALLRQAFQPHFVLRLEALHRLTLFALLFTTVGTMLGGIWADQSWGRFWGWDPKENGALWIVLWLVWVLHGRIAGQLKPLGFVMALAPVTIVVALAWFGVNLLSIGLHSYGFTDAAAYGLLAFCVGEAAIITGLTVMCYQKGKRRHAA